MEKNNKKDKMRSYLYPEKKFLSAKKLIIKERE
jgi:hypothetical protein